MGGVVQGVVPAFARRVQQQIGRVVDQIRIGRVGARAQVVVVADDPDAVVDPRVLDVSVQQPQRQRRIRPAAKTQVLTSNACASCSASVVPEASGGGWCGSFSRRRQTTTAAS